MSDEIKIGIEQSQLEFKIEQHSLVNDCDIEILSPITKWEVEVKTGAGLEAVHHNEDFIGEGTSERPLELSEGVHEILDDVANKLDMTDEPSKVYGTDENGEQTLYNKDDFGKVDDVLVDGESVVENKIASIDLTGKVDKVEEADQIYGTDDQGEQTSYDLDYFAKSVDLQTHITDLDNPHQVTKSQVGLGNVDNTSDANKPISTATQAALDKKQDTLTAGTDLEIVEYIKPNLPEGYTAVEYLQSTGTQYIDTGVLSTDTQIVETTFEFTSFIEGSKNRVFGIRSPGDQLIVYANKFVTQYGTEELYSSVSPVVNKKYTVKQEDNEFYLDDRLLTTHSASTFTSNNNIIIFGLRDGEYYYLGAVNIYTFKILDGETLVRNFIPALDANNRPCLYDSVTETAFYNQGEGEFRSGPTITEDRKIINFTNVSGYALKSYVDAQDDTKVGKVNTANRVYGTDGSGNQTTYSKDSFGKVDDVKVNGTSVVENKIANVTVPTKVSDLNNDSNFQTGSQVASSISTHNSSNEAHPDIRQLISQLDEWTVAQYTATTTNFVVGHTYTVEEAFQRTASLFAGLQGEINAIEAVIPAQATAQNQLADKNFVNATVATNSANFRGNWLTWAEVPTQADQYPEDYVGSRTPTNNDYMVVSDASGYENPSVLVPKITISTKSTGDVSAAVTVTNIITGATEDIHYGTVLRTEKQLFGSDLYIIYGVNGTTWRIYSKINPFAINNVTYDVGSYYEWSYLENKNFNVYLGASDLEGTWRFIYVGDWNTKGKEGWKPTYQIGTPFTQEQQAAIDSGITANMVDNYVDPNSQANTAYNKRITALETDKRDIINSANKVYATDNLGANKNDLTYDKSATADTIAQRGTNGVLKVGTPVDNSDAATKKYVDDGLSAKVDKVNTANRVYGTDAQGNQTTYDADSFGQVDDVKVDGVSVVENKIANIDLTGKQDKLIAGQNIQIDPATNTISATDTTYNAGEGILINNNVISTNNIVWRKW